MILSERYGEDFTSWLEVAEENAVSAAWRLRRLREQPPADSSDVALTLRHASAELARAEAQATRARGEAERDL